MDNFKVAVLLEDIKTQFRMFGEGLEILNDKVAKGFQKMKEFRDEVNLKFDQNLAEHQPILKMIRELNEEQTTDKA